MSDEGPGTGPGNGLGEKGDTSGPEGSGGAELHRVTAADGAQARNERNIEEPRHVAPGLRVRGTHERVPDHADADFARATSHLFFCSEERSSC